MEINIRTLIKILIIFVASIIILALAPRFYKKFQEQLTVAKVKSSYAMLSKSYTSAIEKEDFKWTKNSMNTTIFSKGYLKHLDVQKDCGLDASKNCFPNAIKTLNPPFYTLPNPMREFHKAKLKNGTSIAIKVLSPDCSFIRGRCATIFVDINGLKGPNQFGKDIFDFGIYKKELRPYEIQIVHRLRCLNGNGQGCAAFILKYGNMKYKNFYKLYDKELIQQAKEAAKKKK